MNEFITFVSPVFSLLFIWFLTYTIIHETGHSYTANHYSKTKALIILKWFRDIKNFSISFRNYTFCFGKVHSKSRGTTYLENNFCIYEPSNIRKIAKTGNRWQLVYAILLAIIWFISPYSQSYNKLFIVLGFIVIPTFLSLIPEKYDVNDDNKWPDIRIIDDPEGFLKKRNNLPLDSEERYENAIKRFEIKGR
jgi:hypothetical protein